MSVLDELPPFTLPTVYEKPDGSVATRATDSAPTEEASELLLADAERACQLIAEIGTFPLPLARGALFMRHRLNEH